MKCIIIDDEPLAIDLIKEYCSKIDFIELVGIYTNALDSISIIKEKKVDLIFSDIEMPQINGIDFINSLDNKPLFIFTTAYSQYAVEGFELNAVDYLVKPIPYHRFIKAVSRAKEIITNRSLSMTTNVFPSTGEEKKAENFIFIKADYENIKVNIEEIKYIQGLKDYLKVHILGTNKPILTLMSFKDLLSKLPDRDFVRIHRSFAINVHYIKTIQKNKVVIDDMRIPIGDSYKEDFFDRLGIK
ncbi:MULTISPECIES: LytR/AlgR family response regulator transcription factor [Galbibacter]|uniref:LytTR family DNA-binding domain-containing protein n=1 Tax=Galbibacter pacificus TaxID=2996052 RepID=A0ABT6FUZ1_9FLAO|nr:LytTR family DNA-binding domain-containing protein [Galbibacter pacificus]MDG3583435.1 LytTR family DNA-binding domain-containing protein [Galbibacter pacificus]MDG3587088.1 LytTR family DNA-binding domain-containing protein [Galbibacter pacificus]